MNLNLCVPQMTRDAFFAWAEQQEARYEFDGFQPVAMGNVTVNHSLITNNIHRALYARLRGTGCSALGPEVGISTIGDTVRNPDALVTYSKIDGSDLSGAQSDYRVRGAQSKLWPARPDHQSAGICGCAHHFGAILLSKARVLV